MGSDPSSSGQPQTPATSRHGDARRVADLPADEFFRRASWAVARGVVRGIGLLILVAALLGLVALLVVAANKAAAG